MVRDILSLASDVSNVGPCHGGLQRWCLFVDELDVNSDEEKEIEEGHKLVVVDFILEAPYVT